MQNFFASRLPILLRNPIFSLFYLLIILFCHSLFFFFFVPLRYDHGTIWDDHLGLLLKLSTDFAAILKKVLADVLWASHWRILRMKRRNRQLNVIFGLNFLTSLRLTVIFLGHQGLDKFFTRDSSVAIKVHSSNYSHAI